MLSVVGENSNDSKGDGPRDWSAATENDVYECYRLLLNREPDPAGWTNFISNIRGGMTLESLVSAFLNSVEFRNRAADQTNAYVTPRLCEADGFKIYVYAKDSPSQRALAEGVYEPHVVSALRRLLKPGQVFVDVGASIGYLSMAAARAVTNTGKVICFEPDLQNCKLIYLSAKANHFQNVEIFPFPVADCERNVIFDSMQGNGTISQFDVNLESTPLRFVTRSMTLDKMLENQPPVALLKMDIEGAEYLAVQGARNFLQQHRPQIISEFSPAGLANVSGVSGAEYLQLLCDLGYGISVLDFDGRVIECRRDTKRVLEIFAQHATSHIDILARPE